MNNMLFFIIIITGPTASPLFLQAEHFPAGRHSVSAVAPDSPGRKKTAAAVHGSLFFPGKYLSLAKEKIRHAGKTGFYEENKPVQNHTQW